MCCGFIIMSCPPTKVPHHYGNLPLADPLTIENSAYCLEEDSQEKEKLSKCACRHNLI